MRKSRGAYNGELNLLEGCYTIRSRHFRVLHQKFIVSAKRQRAISCAIQGCYTMEHHLLRC